MPMRMAGIVLLAAVLAAPASAAAREGQWRFAVSKGGKLTGRLDVGVARRDGTLFAVAGFYGGAAAVKEKRTRAKPEGRSYAELEPDGTLGKYKRWEAKGQRNLYWMTFQYGGKVKARFETGLGNTGKVKDVGAGEKVVPLERDQPQLAWLLVDGGHAGPFACVGANPAVLGKAQLANAGPEEIDLAGGAKARLQKWTVTGDCGEYAVWVDAAGDPQVMSTGTTRYDRIAAK
jgi:hypothetical protein